MGKPISSKKESKVVSVRVSPDLYEQIERRALELGITNPFAGDGEIKPNISAYLLGLAKADLGASDAPVNTVNTAPTDVEVMARLADVLGRIDALEAEVKNGEGAIAA